ncbi:MAG: IscS subfamily cysteine desulfurase [Pelagibacterales bacterium]|nr:IscS subfamily cysteine desulfurase [Pelagibacterales bacterium]OUU61824.1 MAG: hypothetical protein CBC22_06115 [Alphaproteobacteria bacterium TMED62]
MKIFNMIYLDNHSTTQVDKRVLKKMIPYFTEKFNNPHSQITIHNQDIIFQISEARNKIAKLIGAEKEEIIFTSGATESNNLAIKGLKGHILRGKNHFISLNTEHKCVLEALRKLEFEGAKVTILKVKKNGLIDADEVYKNIKKNTLLVSIMMANNETGVIQPIKKIAKICKDKNVLFHTDAAQAVGKIDINVKKMNIDMMSISAHKFYGPKGVGALYIRRFPRIRLSPLIDGGGQEVNLRSGTLPVPLCIGLGEAAKISMLTLKKEKIKISVLRDYLYKGLKTKIKNISINGDTKNRLPANLNISIPGINSELLIKSLKNTVISSGSACTSSSVESSYVLSAMGLPKKKIDSSIRIGIGRFTTKSDINHAIKDITQTVGKLRVNG